MGVFIEVPISTSQHAAFHVTFGSITAMDIDSCNITVRLLLGRDNLPDYVLANLGGNDLVQTNALLEVPINWVAGTFRLWPARSKTKFWSKGVTRPVCARCAQSAQCARCAHGVLSVCTWCAFGVHCSVR